MWSRIQIFLVVALRKESVDRNKAGSERINRDIASLSARRAWIEIAKSTPEEAKRWVALRKESVDRNLVVWVVTHVC